MVKVTAKDRDVLDICSDQPALWSMRVAMTGRLYKFGGWRVKLEVKLLYTLREVLAAVAIITRHVIGHGTRNQVCRWNMIYDRLKNHLYDVKILERVQALLALIQRQEKPLRDTEA